MRKRHSTVWFLIIMLIVCLSGGANALEDVPENSFMIHSFIPGEWYNADTGKTEPSPEHARSTELIPLQPGCICLSCDQTSVSLACFDAEMNFISCAYVLTNNLSHPIAEIIIPKGTCYVGVSVEDADTKTLTLQCISSRTLFGLQYPFETGSNYFYIENTQLTDSGSIEKSDEYSLLLLPDLQADQIFVSNSDPVYFLVPFFSDFDLVQGEGKRNHIQSNRIYTVPENTMLAAVHINNTHISGVDGSKTDYVVAYRENNSFSRLAGKKVAAIGDSITYLDGRKNSNASPRDNSTVMRGWQAQLRLQGAYVDNYGYNGYPYTAGTARGDCIWQKVVQEKLDLSNYDIVILFGGANDVVVSAPMGDLPTDYLQPTLNENTFCGAIGSIIQTIWLQNPMCEIYLCTTTPAQTKGREFQKNRLYNQAIRECAEFWGVPVIDLFHTVGYHPYLNFSSFVYDSIHPNIRGMERIGKIIAAYIENSQ